MNFKETLPKGILHLLSAPFWQALLAMLLGGIVFVAFFDLSILDPENVTWIIDGDRLIHYLGSYAYRSDEWLFPITKTNLIAYPEGISILYTDSNPLLSVLFKLFRFIFPPEYQFFGWWFMACWVLQGLLGFLVVKRITSNTVFALLSAILLCVLPTMFHRIMHTNLIAFWIILWAIYVFLMDDKRYKRKELLFFLIFVIAFLTHGYFFFMAAFIAGTWFIKRTLFFLKGKDKRALLFFWGRLFLLTTSFFLVLWVFGVFHNAPEHNFNNGFGDYSMNLLAPFDPRGSQFSSILPGLAHKKMQTVEGFQFLGLGIILLFSGCSIILFKTEKIKQSLLAVGVSVLLSVGLMLYFKELPLHHLALLSLSFLFVLLMLIRFKKEKTTPLFWLILPAFVCIVLALSNQVYLGETKVLSYSVFENGIGAKFFRIVRSSGRFFWVTTLVFILISLHYIFHAFKSKMIAFFIVGLCLFIQLLDLAKVGTYLNNFPSSTNKHELATPIKQMIAAAKRLDFIEVSNHHISLEAIKNNVPINAFYIVHGYGKLTHQKITKEINGLKNGSILLNDSTLYFIKKTQSWQLPNSRALNYYSFDAELYAVTTKNFVYHNPNFLPIKQGDFSLTGLFNRIKTNRLTVFAVNDEASTKMPSFFANKLDETYGTKLSQLGFRAAYIAVFQNGALIYEDMAQEQELLHTFKTDSNTVVVNSSTGRTNLASIVINAKEYSLNKRGLNVVLINDKNEYKAMNFDTYGRDYNY